MFLTWKQPLHTGAISALTLKHLPQVINPTNKVRRPMLVSTNGQGIIIHRHCNVTISHQQCCLSVSCSMPTLPEALHNIPLAHLPVTPQYPLLLVLPLSVYCTLKPLLFAYNLAITKQNEFAVLRIKWIQVTLFTALFR